MHDNKATSIMIRIEDFSSLFQGADSAAASSIKGGKPWQYKLIPEDTVAANVDLKFAISQAIKMDR